MSKSQVWSVDRSLKQCSKCGAMKPLDSFHRRKLKSRGFTLASWCRECSRAKALECANRRYREDPQWRAAKLAKDRAEGMARRAAHRAEHPRVLLTPEERIEHQRASLRKYAARPEAKEKHRIQSSNRRALEKYAAEGERITKEAWKQIIAEYNSRCAYCKVQTEFLELDHVVPLSRGGKHERANIVPACRACNTSKNNRTLDEWTPPEEPQRVLRPLGRRGPWKLTDEQVAEIRTRRAAGEKGRTLAREFGVHEQTITELYRGRSRIKPVVA